ncbi:C13 family peptidase [Vitreimonas sp.]|uniref:C13 family peptidase n=1 Tax=Vitreimonas sp. TaxID=3069702 RepID=UPI002EDB6372
MARFWMLIALLWAAFAAPVAAQQQRDPFNGQFGSFEIAAPPGEAARLAKLMGDSLDGLAPQRPGQLDVYMISAGFWSDAVFERETTQAAEILGAHFGDAVQGRSIVLSAGGQGVRNYPAATPDNFSAAIGQVGATIDPNEDLVVLFLTSHGSPDGSIAIREHNRLGASMRPTHLRDMLNAAGIRNRVIIVSACFSGAFIAPLMDDNTIILTAAQHDRSSFGCQPQRDWTFFGDALFSHNLRNGEPLLEAFDRAKVLIERWEREQRLTPPSNPQRSVGARAADMLRRAERAAR